VIQPLASWATDHEDIISNSDQEAVLCGNVDPGPTASYERRYITVRRRTFLARRACPSPGLEIEATGLKGGGAGAGGGDQYGME